MVTICLIRQNERTKLHSQKNNDEISHALIIIHKKRRKKLLHTLQVFTRGYLLYFGIREQKQI